ncbi:MAG: hypothetical protein HQ581_17755 [Planctomycetes bacterium]|nr:hypothetical protein [Planctomycetota bacterium]
MSRPENPIAAMVALNVVASSFTSVVVLTSRGGALAAIMGASTILTQSTLLATWASLGGRPAPWRLLGVGLALGLLIGPTPPASREALPIWSLLMMFLLGTVATGLTLLLLRLLGLGLVNCPDEPVRLAPRRLQFSLGLLFEWTTATAVVMGVCAYVPREFFAEFAVWRSLSGILLVWFAASSVALGALCVSLWAARLGARIATLFVIQGTAITVVAVVIDNPDAIREGIIPCFLVSTAWLVGSLWFVRIAGYRLVWRRMPVRSLDS